MKWLKSGTDLVPYFDRKALEQGTFEYKIGDIVEIGFKQVGTYYIESSDKGYGLLLIPIGNPGEEPIKTSILHLTNIRAKIVGHISERPLVKILYGN